MNVVHIVGSLEKKAGGPSRSVPQSCEFLAKMKINIDLITNPGVDVVKVNTNAHFKVLFKNIWELYAYSKTLDEKKVDLIHLQHIWTPYIHIIARAARKKGIPYIITPRGMLEPWIMKRNSWKKKLAMMLYQHNDLKNAKVIHVTGELERKNIQKLGYTQEISIIPNGIDLAAIPQPKENYGAKKMVFLSRIHQKKGIELLLDAWGKVKNEEWILEIAGQGDEKYVNQLINKINRESIKNVIFVGPKYGNEKWSFIKSADIFILPTFSENFGIVVAEALAMGVPVITTTGTPWEDLEYKHCGWWIDLSMTNLVSTLDQAMNTPVSKLKEMGENGIKLVLECYDIRMVANSLYKLYSTIKKEESKKLSSVI